MFKSSKSRTDWAISLLSFVFIASLVFFGIYRLTPPDPLPATAAPTEFSAGRAIKHIENLAQQPRPTGSPAIARVHDYLVQELTTLGLEIEKQEIPSGAPLFDIVGRENVALISGNLSNIVAKLPGTHNTRAILLVAHYDSEVSSLGASDGAAGVATILETVRALKAGPPLKNDVVVLLTQGEELDQMGMRGFVNYQPYIQDIGLAFNFVARGTSGPAIMFETSPENGWLIEEFAKSAPYPVANSLTYDVYKYMPNSSDFTPLRAKGIAGLNFAYIGNHAFYHTLLDNSQNLDQRSLQHLGSYALALTHHFGQLDLVNIKKGNAVYFDIWSLALVHYPQAWVIPLSILVTLVFVGVMVFGFRKRQLTLSGIVGGILALLLAATVAWASISLIWQLVRAIHPEYRLMPSGDTYNTHVYLVSFVTLTIAITSTIYILFRKKISMPNLSAGVLCVWLILMLVSSFYLPGGSYLFMWPLLFSLLSWGITFASKSQEPTSIRHWAIFSLGALPGIVLFVPTIYLIYEALTIGYGGWVMILAVLLLGLLAPHIALIAKPHKWWLPGAALLACLGFLVAGSLTAGFDTLHRKPSALTYYLNTTSGEAFWISPDPQLNEWTSLYIRPGTEKKGPLSYDTPYWVPDSDYTLISSQAPVVQLGAPQIEILSDNTSNGIRALRMRLTSSRHVWMTVLLLHLQSPLDSVKFLKAGFDGTLVDFSDRLARRKPKNPANELGAFVYMNPPQEGVEITIEMTYQPLKLVIYDESLGFPEIPDMTFKPRPDYMMPSIADALFYDAVLVSKVYKLP